MNKQFLLATCAVLTAAGLAGAHLTPNSLVPSGGQTFTVGDTTTISWNVAVAHGQGIDVSFSKDGGKSWSTVKSGIQDKSTGPYSLKWTVPGDVTTSGKIRICLTAGVPCTDANNVSDPGTSAPYVLVSGNFTISATSAVLAQESFPGSSLRFNAETRNVDVTFALDQARTVTLQAFDTQGRVVATLLQGAQNAGEHHFSVFSSRLDARQPLVFKLDAGDGRVLTQAWNGIQ